MFLWLLTFYQTGPNGLFIFYQVFNLILQSASLFSCILIWFDPTQRVALYYTIPFVAICYLVQYLWRKFDKNLRLAEEGK